MIRPDDSPPQSRRERAMGDHRRVVDQTTAQIEVLALKVVKQRWLLRGQEPTPQLTRTAMERIKAEIGPFLEDVAGWAINAERSS